MQQFFSLLSWHLFTAQHVSGVFPPIIRSSMTAVAASGFTFVSWWQLCCVRGRVARPAGPTTNTARLSRRYKGKTKAATAVIELLIMGGKTPETCWAVNNRQDNKLENCCIWLVIYLNCTVDVPNTGIAKDSLPYERRLASEGRINSIEVTVCVLWLLKLYNEYYLACFIVVYPMFGVIIISFLHITFRIQNNLMSDTTSFSQVLQNIVDRASLDNLLFTYL